MSDNPVCKWEVEDDEERTWATGCGELFAINNGTPAQNGMRFCCYCGYLIVVEGEDLT